MNIFKMLFGRKNKADKKENESWYNNSHEKKRKHVPKHALSSYVA